MTTCHMPVNIYINMFICVAIISAWKHVCAFLQQVIYWHLFYSLARPLGRTTVFLQHVCRVSKRGNNSNTILILYCVCKHSITYVPTSTRVQVYKTHGISTLCSLFETQHTLEVKWKEEKRWTALLFCWNSYSKSTTGYGCKFMLA